MWALGMPLGTVIVTILFCPFDTKVCVRVMSWMLRKWWLLILVVG
eukprot:COSAG03_NODE_28617_length_196_cov_15.474227_1_plen_44_part_01